MDNLRSNSGKVCLETGPQGSSIYLVDKGEQVGYLPVMLADSCCLVANLCLDLDVLVETAALHSQSCHSSSSVRSDRDRENRTNCDCFWFFCMVYRWQANNVVSNRKGGSGLTLNTCTVNA